MRMFWIPMIIAIIINIVIDIFLYRKIVASRCAKWVRVGHVLLSVLLSAALIIALIIGPRSGSVLFLMWTLYTYLSVYIPKYFYCIFHGLSAVPRLWKRGSLRWSQIAGMIVAFGVLIAMWHGALYNRYNTQIVSTEVSSPRLPAAFSGYRIVQISDLHLGTYGTDTSYVSKLVTQINDLKPDLIVFTGDLVNSQSDESDPFVRPLSRLKAADGVLSILGNHDYGDYRNWPSPEAKAADFKHLVDNQKAMHWRMLDNEYVALRRGNDSIAIIGVQNWGDPPFPTYGDLHKAYPALTDSCFKILLTHNPAHWRAEVTDATNIDLSLAGHTHAMQIEVDLFGHRFSPSAWRYKEWGGMYEHGEQRLYVNIGVGCVGFPARLFAARPEVTILTLRKK